MDARPCEPLPIQRWHRWAHVQNEPAGSAGDDGAVVAADDDRPDVRREVYIPAVLWENRRQLYRGRVEERRAPAPRLVSEHPRRPQRGSSGRHRENEGASPNLHWRGACTAVGKVAGVLATLC